MDPSLPSSDLPVLSLVGMTPTNKRCRQSSPDSSCSFCSLPLPDLCLLIDHQPTKPLTFTTTTTTSHSQPQYYFKEYFLTVFLLLQRNLDGFRFLFASLFFLISHTTGLIPHRRNLRSPPFGSSSKQPHHVPPHTDKQENRVFCHGNTHEIMASYYNFNAHAHPAQASHNNHHGGRNRRAPRVSVSQNSHRQFRGVRSMKELNDSAALSAFRMKFEAGRSFELEDDLEFCPGLLTETDVSITTSR